jgi:hypothetical protein
MMSTFGSSDREIRLSELKMSQDQRYIDSWILLANVIINIEGVVVKPCKREDLLKSKCCNRG